MRPRNGFFSYVTAAFLWHWNLLALGGGVIFAFLSRKPDMFLPLISAAELFYLGMLATRPRFRAAIDALAYRDELPPEADLAALERIRAQIKPEVWQRFDRLRQRCLSLSHLAEQLRGPQSSESSRITAMQTESLERLLWMFLKLVYSQDALQRFLHGTDRELLKSQIADAEKEIKEATANNRSEKLLRSLEDKLQTLNQRLANFDRAEENHELLTAEIDRIEQKVNAISELSISSRDPVDVSAQVDGIAEGVSMTEETIRKLDMPSLLETEAAPRFLSQKE